MVVHIVLLLGAVLCAWLAVRSRPLAGALWLAGLSAIVAVFLFRLGAPEIAVIELSVGAGLITVLLAFAISMAEDESLPTPLLPRPFAWVLVAAACGGLLWLLVPNVLPPPQTAQDAPLVIELWDNRLLDLVLQVVVILGGVIGVLSLLGETRVLDAPAAREMP